MHLIMPMAGSGSRFAQQGFNMPKPLIPIKNHPFFYWATQSIVKYLSVDSLTFVVLRDHVLQYDIDKVIYNFYPDAVVHVLDHVLDGAMLTCAEGIKKIEDDAPIMFNDCDHIFTCKAFYDDYNKKNKVPVPDGTLLTFCSNDPKFSYLKLDTKGKVISTVEKQVISNHAICGAYFFKNRSVFETAMKQYIDDCPYSEYYMSGLYNNMAANNLYVSYYTVDMHIPFGTPEEYHTAQKAKEEFLCLL